MSLVLKDILYQKYKYVVEINPVLTDMETIVFGSKDYEVVKVTIDKSK